MKLKVKLLTDTAKIQVPNTGDAGLDLFIDSIENESRNTIKYHLGVAMEIPERYVGLIFHRSSVKNYNSRLTNSVGVIDSSYRGPIVAICDRTEYGEEYKVGDKAFQIVIVPYVQISELEYCDTLSFTHRGDKGFGSTGKS